MQTLRVNNSRILRMKNTKFSEYYINLNSTIQEDFQICISVYLQILLSKKQVSWSIKSINSTTFFPVIQKQESAFLILIWVGFLGVHFEVYVHKYNTPCLVSENITFSTKALLILLISFFFAKNHRFLAKIVPLLKAIVWELCLRFFSFVFSFCKIKACYSWKYKFYADYASRICVLNCSKLVINWKNGNDVTIFQNDAIVNFLTLFRFSGQV